MADPYTSVTVSNYNANPPPDDGTAVPTNRITWAGIKTKLGDPLNTAVAAINTNVDAALAKTLSGASIVSTAVSYPMTAADQGRSIVVTAGGQTVTTPDATVVHNPFMFLVKNSSTGNMTLDGNGAQTVDGNTTIVFRPGSGAIVYTDGSNWFTSGTVPATIPTTNPAYGFDAPINLALTASVGSNILTIAAKANDGTDASASNPILIPFRDPTIANGGPIWRAVTAALSINTNAVGATLGSSNSVPFRFWIVAFDDGGTVRLALKNCSTATQIFDLIETNPASATGISAAATSAGVFYCPNGVTITSKSFRVIGYLDYSSGLVTAGTYASAPVKLSLFGPGVKKPGDVVQISYNNITSSGTTANNWVPSNTPPVIANGGAVGSLSLTSITSPINRIRVTSCVLVMGATSGDSSAWLYNGSAVVAAATGRNNNSVPVPILVTYEAINAAALTYTLYASSLSGVTTWNGSAGTAWFGGLASTFIRIEEIMG